MCRESFGIRQQCASDLDWEALRCGSEGGGRDEMGVNLSTKSGQPSNTPADSKSFQQGVVSYPHRLSYGADP